jgi:hypothetical protein
MLIPTTPCDLRPFIFTYVDYSILRVYGERIDVMSKLFTRKLYVCESDMYLGGFLFCKPPRSSVCAYNVRVEFDYHTYFGVMCRLSADYATLYPRR